MNGKSLANTTLPRSDDALVRCSYLVKENITKREMSVLLRRCKDSIFF